MPNVPSRFIQEWLEAETALAPADPVLTGVRASLVGTTVDEVALLKQLLRVRLLPVPERRNG